MKNTVLAALLVIAAVIGGLWFSREKETPPASGKAQVTASFYPLAHFAQKTAGEDAEVTGITPAGAEPHDFEPTPRDIKKILSSRVFIYNGGGFDPWADRISAELKEKGVLLVNMSENFRLIESDSHEHHDAKESKQLDPHIWLDPMLAAKEVAIISGLLSKTDPSNADGYAKRASNYAKELEALHRKFEDGLKSCRTRDIIVSHNAFSYMGLRYNLNIHAISGISAGGDPSPRRIGNLAKLAKEKDIRYIFFETLASPRIAETIANEAGVETLVLNPLEGLTPEELDRGEDYISVMEQNLENLRKALECR